MSRLIDAEALKEHKFVGNKYVQDGGRTNGKTLSAVNKAYQQGWNDAIDAIIDNAPAVPLPEFKEGYKQAIIDGKTNFSRPQGDCENCDFRKFTETFINGVVEVMNKNGITSVEQLSEILKGGAE